jgi:hypothetical protein
MRCSAAVARSRIVNLNANERELCALVAIRGETLLNSGYLGCSRRAAIAELRADDGDDAG